MLKGKVMTDIAKTLSSLSPEKRKLLELKLKQKGARFNSFPLSYAQQRLWFLDQMHPGSPLYNIPMAWKISGALNISLFEKAISTVIDRHEILRTTFTTVSGKGMQLISAETRVEIEKLDIPASNSDGKERLSKVLFEKFRHSFNLQKGPLGLVTLVKTAKDEYVLVVVLHHIISDGWSMGILMREFSTLYQAFLKNESSPLPALKIQYADFAQWQKKWLQGERLQNQLDYWKKQLGEYLPPVLELPLDHPRPAVISNKGSKTDIQIDSTFRKKIEQLASKNEATPFMLLMSVLQILLYRYTRQDDITIGTPIANRNRAETENLIGFFVNTLVIRGALDSQLFFEDFLKQIKETTLDAYANQDLPFEMLVEEIHPERSMSHSPLFQVMMVYQNIPQRAITMPDLNMEALNEESGTAKFDLTVMAAETAEGLLISFEYNTDLFEDTTISNMADHFKKLLKQVCDNPQQKISQISFLSAAELEKVLYGFNDNHADFTSPFLINEKFEQIVEHYPDNTALVLDKEEITYQQLNEKADVLASLLIEKGVQSDQRIGICMQRSFDMFIGLLAILKSGAAFVPIDPTYPTDRINYMIKDAQISLLLANKDTSEVIEKLIPQNNINTIQTIYIDGDILSSINPKAPKPVLSPQNLAYIIYTSGSTGRPKGTLVSHGSVMNLKEAMLNEMPLDQNDKVLQFFSFGFDGFIWDFLTLFRGASLVLLNKDTISSGEKLADSIEENQITMFTVTPSVLSVIPNREFPKLQKVCTAAEKSSTEIIHNWGRRFNYYNAYGPTEATVASTIFVAPKDYATLPPIGKPLKNVQCFVLDEQMNPVAIGVPGELYIGGESLARGYHNRTDLTAEKFIPNPFSNIAGERLYRTGDLVKWKSDGNLDFLGRIDQQVKIRGFRIELGEIENTLFDHIMIKDALVTTTKDQRDEDRLVAYLISENSKHPETEEIQIYLKATLPDYMVPSVFLYLDSFPLTPNGKIDTNSLPIPDQDSMQVNRFIAPRTTAEEILSKIWAEILNIKQVGVLDNFFDLGGHSLLATQLVSRIRDEFNLELELKTLFETTTLEKLARIIENLGEDEFEKPPLQRTPRETSIPLSFSQQRLWFLDQLEPGSASYNIPVAIKTRGPLNIEALKNSLNEIMHRQEVFRTAIETEGGQPKIIIHDEMPVPLIIEDLSILDKKVQDQRVETLVVEEARKSFQLHKAPLFRVRVLLISENESVLLITMHHIISDGWSVGILFYELSHLYAANSKGEPSLLTELPVQYADYAYWQRSWLKDTILEKQLNYWKEKLGGAPALLELPTDNPRPAIQTYNGSHFPLSLSEETSAKVREFSNEHGVTLFMTLLAAFKILLSKYSRQNDISVGTPIANRTRSDVEGIIGFFVNTLVFRSVLENQNTFTQFLGEIRKTSFEAYAHQDVPFEKVVDFIDPVRDTSHSPLFQVMFTMQNNPQKSIQSSDLTFDFLEIENRISKFDLMLTFVEHPKQLIGSIEYNSDLFNQNTVRRMAGHFGNLIEAIMENPYSRLNSLNYLNSSELKQLISGFNSQYQLFNTQSNIAKRFEQQTELTPQNNALIYNDENISYQNLNEQANKIAHMLLAKGIKEEQFVGISMNRSINMVAAMLGILKAGAAYLPMDPTYPQERLNFMLEDTQASILFTSTSLAKISAREGLDIIDLDDPGFYKDYSAQNPEINIDSRQTAYLIYTSGSTGVPKGVSVEHRNIMSLVQWGEQTFQRESFDGYFFSTSINFDVSVFELFTTLAVGGCAIIADNALSLADLKSPESVHTISTVPSAIAELLRLEAIPSSVKHVQLAGEFLATDIVNKLYQLPHVEQVHDIYGPSEQTVYSTHKFRQKNESATIGNPLANTKALILDEEMNVVPLGVPGELHLSGQGQARGYFNRPELTAQRFIPNPHSEEPGSRLYKTGDLVKWLESGEIEYLGRIDHQVKIRGFRIEMGEIESALLEHEKLQDAVVNVYINKAQEKQLAAYLVTTNGKDIAISELREHLSKNLPEYMVPSYFVFLEEIPLAPNGKVNRKGLPEPEISRKDLATNYKKAQTEQEKILVGIWQSLLNIKQVGVNDNFFELGGDSIMGIQVIARAKQSGIHLTPLQMFQNQTIAKLASVAKTAVIVNAEQGLVTGTSRITPVQQYFFNHNFAENHHWNQSVIMKTRSPLKREFAEKALQRLLEHHDTLRSKFETQESGITQIFSEEINVAESFEWIDLNNKNSDEISLSIKEESSRIQASLNIEYGPLVKMVYFSCGDEQDRLLMIVHHLVMDGISWRLILEDFQLAYEQIKKGKESILPPKSTSFKEWSDELHKYTKTDRIQSQKIYWTEIAQKPAATVFKDFPTGENLENSMENISVSLDQIQTSDLLQEAPKAYKTQISDLLATALIKGFSRWTGRRNLLLHMEGHGREHISDGIDISRTIGWFTNIYPVYLDLGKAVNLGDQIKSVKEQINQIPDKGFGFGLLRYLSDDLNTREQLKKLDSISILFNYLGQFDQVIDENSPLLPSADDDKGFERSPNAHRMSLIDISGSISGGKLSMVFSFSRNQFRTENIQRFATGYLDELIGLIKHCKNPSSAGATASDFKLSGLDNKKLGKVLGKLVKKK